MTREARTISTTNYQEEAERLLQESLDVQASLEEKAFLVAKAQVYATLALMRATRNLRS